MSTLDPGRLPALLPGPSWRPLCVLPCPSPQSLVAALTVPASAGQGAAHAVRVGALSRPGRAQPLRGLAAPGHLSIQHGAGPLSVVATSRGFWAGSARGGHTGLVSACHNQTSGEDGTVGSLPGPLQNQLDGAGWMDEGGVAPHPRGSCTAPAPLRQQPGRCGALAGWCREAAPLAQGPSRGQDGRSRTCCSE